MNTYHLGTMIRIVGVFRDNLAGLADPTAISVIVRDPSENETTYTYGGLGTIVRDSLGTYHQDITIGERGVWYYEWQGAGAITATDEDAFYCAEGEV